ncbi:MAG TPA: hypothetical protein VNP20_04100, partial [Nocardioidaceae bacterium]|nr:hypothetical protein [Nocardioidaceae bacterium]
MPTTRTPRRITPDRVAISVVLGGAVIVALVFLTLGTFDAVRTLVAPEIRVSLVADAAIGSLNGVPVDG